MKLPRSVVEALRRHRTAQIEHRFRLGSAYQNRDLVFVRPPGEPVTCDQLRHAFAGLLKKARLPRVRFHDLRHTTATLTLAQGEHLKAVSERLGHASVAITGDIYSHVQPGIQAEAAERLDAVDRRPTSGNAVGFECVVF